MHGANSKGGAAVGRVPKSFLACAVGLRQSPRRKNKPRARRGTTAVCGGRAGSAERILPAGGDGRFAPQRPSRGTSRWTFVAKPGRLQAARRGKSANRGGKASRVRRRSFGFAGSGR